MNPVTPQKFALLYHPCTDGEFTKLKIAEFVFANKMPLVTTFTRETAQMIFESPIKKQVKYA